MGCNCGQAKKARLAAAREQAEKKAAAIQAAREAKKSEPVGASTH